MEVFSLTDFLMLFNFSVIASSHFRVGTRFEGSQYKEKTHRDWFEGVCHSFA